ncbi:HNH endonuclease [Pseudodesulfovibrio karagichevae]|uniref:HNH endonuclease n=1 Tax=Pseudodesulfovibrio karagichevae TaxID=3239305 RepID=A0ABV4K7S5_9BACT
MKTVEYIASAEEYRNALGALKKDEVFKRHQKLLAAHYSMPEHKATSAELALVCRMHSGSSVDGTYVHLGSRIYDRLPSHAQDRIVSKKNWKIQVLCHWEASGYGTSVWTLRAEVVEALEQLGWVQNTTDHNQTPQSEQGNVRSILPTTDQIIPVELYVKALSQIHDEMNSRELSVIKAHYEVFGQQATAGQLSNYTGLGQDYRAVNRVYGMLARRINSITGAKVDTRADGSEKHIEGIISTRGLDQEGHALLRMKPTFAEALGVVGLVDVDGLEGAAEDNIDMSSGSTTRLALSQARVGQGRYRQSLLEVWDGRCSVTGVSDTRLLYASHIKPWKNSTDVERLDKFNGLLLTPTLDAAFDKGLISFMDSGKIAISNYSKGDLMKLGIHGTMCIADVQVEHHNYLKYHREHVFQG